MEEQGSCETFSDFFHEFIELLHLHGCVCVHKFADKFSSTALLVVVVYQCRCMYIDF